MHMIFDFLLFKKKRDQKGPLELLPKLDVQPSKYILCTQCGSHTDLPAQINILDLQCENCCNCGNLVLRSYRWMKKAY